MNNRCKLKIMSRVILFMLPQLARGIGNHLAFLHKYTSKALARSITIHHKVLPDVRERKDLGSSNLGLEFLKASFTLL